MHNSLHMPKMAYIIGKRVRRNEDYDMGIMTVFHMVVAVFGAYMIGAALGMKKSGKVSSMVIAEEELRRCRDKQSFIDYLYWKEAVFGGVVLLAGVLGIINDLVVSLGAFRIVQMLLFLAAFLWFQSELRKAREKFL